MEEIQVKLDRLQAQPFFFRLPRQDVVAVLALRPGGDLQGPSPAGQRDGSDPGWSGVAHVIKRAHRDRPIGQKDEIVVEVLFDPFPITRSPPGSMSPFFSGGTW